MSRIYRKGRDGIFFAYWFWNGVRVTRSTGTRRKRDAQRAGDELERAFRDQAHAAADLEAGLAWALSRLRESLHMGGKAPSTLRNVAAKGGHLVRILGPATRLSTFEPPKGLGEITRYVATRLAEKAKRSTISAEVNILRMALRQAAREGRFRGDTSLLSVPELRGAHKPRKRWLTKTEADAVVAATPAQWREHVEVYLETGVRRMELYRIESRDVDLHRNQVHVRGTKTHGADRRIPLSPRARAILERLARRQDIGPLFREWTRVHLDLPAIAKRIGIEAFTCSDLRRTFASSRLSNGVSPSVLKELLGHTTTRQIDLVYGHASEEARQAAVGSRAVAVSVARPATRGTKGTVSGRKSPKRAKRRSTS